MHARAGAHAMRLLPAPPATRPPRLRAAPFRA